MSSFIVPFAQRRTFRHSVRVDCQVVRERDFKLVARRTLDVSSGGMLVAAEAKVLTGEQVLVSFRAPRTDRWVDAHATVTRVVHGRRPGDGGRALGLQFDSLDVHDEVVLRAALRRTPPTRARRPPRIDYAATIALIRSR